MKYRGIPGTRFEVSEVGFCVGTLSSEHYRNREREIFHLIRYGLDRGINFFEASDFLGDQARSECLLGDALCEERDRIVIATKTDFVFSDFDKYKATKKKKFSPKRVRTACEDSLRRLRTDRIDLYQIHYPGISSVEYDDLYGLLKKLRRQGKIRSWGGVFGPETGWLEESKLLIQLRKPAAVQMNFNLLELQPGLEFIESAEKKKVGVLAGLPHCNTVLTQGDLWEQNQVWRKPNSNWFTQKVGQKALFEFLIQRGARTLGQAALKFVLSFPTVVSAVADIYDEDQLNEYVTVSEKPNLTPAEIVKIEALYQPEPTVKTPRKDRNVLEFEF